MSSPSQVPVRAYTRRRQVRFVAPAPEYTVRTAKQAVKAAKERLKKAKAEYRQEQIEAKASLEEARAAVRRAKVDLTDSKSNLVAIKKGTEPDALPPKRAAIPLPPPALPPAGPRVRRSNTAPLPAAGRRA